MNAVEQALAGALQGDLEPLGSIAADTVIRTAHRHGVGSLLHALLARNRQAPVAPGLREALREHSLATAALELTRARELNRLLGLMAGTGIEPILMKGTSLAYLHYEQPSLRERGDTDLLARASDKTRLFAVLEADGYRRPNATSGEWVSSEASFAKEGSSVVLDVHWRSNNSPLLSPALEFEQACRRAVPLPRLGPQAHGLGAIDALLLVATHRATHHINPYYVGDIAHRGDRLIWLYDLHLLTAALTLEQCGDLADRASRHGVAGLCLDALRATQGAFGTPLPPALMDRLARDASRPEPSMVFLRGGRRRLLLAELRALRGWRQRWQLLREHAFPPADYMLRKYETRRRWLLPALYVRRAFGWLTR